jgi:hypothetical protein
MLILSKRDEGVIMILLLCVLKYQTPKSPHTLSSAPVYLPNAMQLGVVKALHSEPPKHLDIVVVPNPSSIGSSNIPFGATEATWKTICYHVKKFEPFQSELPVC